MTKHNDFRRALLNWYRRHGRDLPWRRTRDPYAILVSEVMLQQTQVATVIPYYNEWLRHFPNIAALAKTSTNDILVAWQGLGYYRRAENLHAAAQLIQDRHRGIFPRDIDSLRNLPGVGRYIANAVASFAFDQSVPIVEANTARVLARLFDIRKAIDSTQGREELWRRAGELIPKRSAARFNSALLDLGALVCVPGQAKCGVCPVRKFCLAKSPAALPIKTARPNLKEGTENHAFVVRGNKILLQPSAKRWRGMWILPRIAVRSTSTRPLHTLVFPFTNHRITLRIFRGEQRNFRNNSQRWFPLRQLDSVPIPSPHRRAIVDLLH